MAPPAAKLKVVKPTPESCEGCEVMKLRDELNGQNIDSFRMEMAERWRMQEEDNRVMKESVGKMSSSVNLFVTEMHTLNLALIERIHKLEKNLVYVTITVVVAAFAAWGSKLLP